MEKLSREDLEENIAIIKINKSFYDGMPDLNLYDVTRGCWKRKLESVSKAEYVLSVAFGEVKEVYKVNKWVPASELKRETIPYDEERYKNRIGFHGKIADATIRDKYIGKSVADLFKFGEADPVKVFLKEAAGVTLPDDINTAVKPVMVIQTEEKPLVVCPRCEETFLMAKRCPECGQLMLYKEKWNKPKLANLEEWEMAANLIGATSREAADFVRKVCKNEGFSYHIGAVDLSIDIVDSANKMLMKTFMLFGNGDGFAFQPSSIEQYAEKNGLNKDGISAFLEDMKPFLRPNQKNQPYERYNGYYYINYEKIITNGNDMEQILIKLRDSVI